MQATITSIEISMEVGESIYTSMEVSMEVGGSKRFFKEVSRSFHGSTWNFPLSMGMEASIFFINRSLHECIPWKLP